MVAESTTMRLPNRWIKNNLDYEVHYLIIPNLQLEMENDDVIEVYQEQTGGSMA